MDTKTHMHKVDDMETTRVRDMREVVDEARAREVTAMRGGRVADAAMYREIADRAAEVAAKEAKLARADRRPGRTTTPDEVELSAREQWKWAWIGIALTLCALGVFLSGCSGVDGGPKDRPATAAEASAQPLEFEARYLAPFVEPFWRDWRGLATVELATPEAGESATTAKASLGDGFEGLEGCLSAELAGVWTLEAGGVLRAEFVDVSGTTVRVDGTLTARSERVPNPHSDHVYETTIVGSGTWEATLGPGCAGDFANGTSGVWTCSQSERAAQAAADPRPGTRAFLLAEDGTVTTLIGPREETIFAALEALK
jgi:hypothetical protein